MQTFNQEMYQVLYHITPTSYPSQMQHGCMKWDEHTYSSAEMFYLYVHNVSNLMPLQIAWSLYNITSKANISRLNAANNVLTLHSIRCLVVSFN